MPDIVIAAPPGAFLASLGAVVDAHALLGALYETNRSLADYSRMATRLRVVTPDGGPVTLAGGRTLPADGGLILPAEPRLVYVPALETGPHAGSDPMIPPEWLAERHARGAVIAAAGAGVWALAQAGLLNDAAVCVEPRLAPAFRQAFPRLAIEPVRAMSPAGPVMTCGALAFEREFTARVFGKALAPGVGEWVRMCWGGVTDTTLPLAADPLIAQAQLWIRERFTEAFRIQDLATVLAVSHQTLIRRFRRTVGVTPRDYAQGLRVQAARMMLRETERTVAEIAALVGYSDIPTFRSVFQAHVGQAPSAYRQSVRRPAG